VIQELKVVICADDIGVGYLPMLLAQLIDRDINHEFIPVPRPWAWKNKVEAWIEGLGDHQGRACFVDAYDVLMFGTDEELYHKIDVPLIFSGDRENWPVKEFKDLFPDIGVPWRYINAGGLAGEADTLRSFLNWVDSRMILTIPAGAADCEQAQFAQYYLGGHGVIDRQGSIFHSLNKDPKETLIPWSGRWLNTYTGQRPVFIHGAGKSFKSRPDIFPPPAWAYKSWNWYWKWPGWGPKE
jgi:hypothetical protein